MQKIRIHVILDEMDKKIVEVIRSFPNMEVVQWDYSFDTAYQWTLSNRQVPVDVFLASEYTQVSTTDESGKQIPRDTALLRRIRDIYLLRPHSKFLLLCDHERTLLENKSFLSSLVSVGIYDFRTVETLTEEKLREYIEEPKRDVSYVQEYLSDDLRGTRTSHQVKQIDVVEEEDEEEEETFFSRAKQRLQGIVFRRKEEAEDEELPVEDEFVFEEIQQEEEVRPTREVVNIYSFGLDLNEPSIVSFKDWDQMLFACRTVTPGIVIFSSDTSNLSKRIGYLKKNYEGIIVAVVGDTKEATEADEVFQSWDRAILEKLKEREPSFDEIEETKDDLTSVCDRKFLDKFLKRQVDIYRYRGTSFSFLMIDIDYFKQINDTYGHQEGDKILAQFASFLSRNVRDNDVVTRYGGEKFSIILPGTSKSEAGQVAHKLRQKWKSGKTKMTFSVGVAEAGVDGETAEELVRAADNALYRAKKGGRDLICLAGEVEKTTRTLTLAKPGKVQTTVYMVVGSAPRVGATSFCLALASHLSQNRPVEILDAGGGASEWLKDKKIPVRKVPPFSVIPGAVTIVDAGTNITKELQPFTEAVFVVTDLSRNSVNIKEFAEGASSVYLVGNRGAPLSALHELANLWNIKVFASLSEEPLLREAELSGRIIVPKQWKKQLNKIRGL